MKTKTYITIAIIYAIIALTLGIFYREFSRLFNYTEYSKLRILHTHFLTLGTFFFLILSVLEHNLKFSNHKTDILLILYHVVLSLTGLSMLLSGINVTASLNLRAINVIVIILSAVGHTVLGISFIMILFNIRNKKIKEE